MPELEPQSDEEAIAWQDGYDTLQAHIRRWAEHELALLQNSGVRNYGQEQIVNAVLHRLTTGDWSTGEDEGTDNDE